MSRLLQLPVVFLLQLSRLLGTTTGAEELLDSTHDVRDPTSSALNGESFSHDQRGEGADASSTDSCISAHDVSIDWTYTKNLLRRVASAVQPLGRGTVRELANTQQLWHNIAITHEGAAACPLGHIALRLWAAASASSVQEGVVLDESAGNRRKSQKTAGEERLRQAQAQAEIAWRELLSLSLPRIVRSGWAVVVFLLLDKILAEEEHKLSEGRLLSDKLRENYNICVEEDSGSLCSAAEVPAVLELLTEVAAAGAPDPSAERSPDQVAAAGAPDPSAERSPDQEQGLQCVYASLGLQVMYHARNSTSAAVRSVQLDTVWDFLRSTSAIRDVGRFPWALLSLLGNVAVQEETFSSVDIDNTDDSTIAQRTSSRICIFVVDSRPVSSDVLRVPSHILQTEEYWSLSYFANYLFSLKHGYRVERLQPAISEVGGAGAGAPWARDPSRKIGWAKVKLLEERLEKLGPDVCAFGISIDSDAFFRLSEETGAAGGQHHSSKQGRSQLEELMGRWFGGFSARPETVVRPETRTKIVFAQEPSPSWEFPPAAPESAAPDAEDRPRFANGGFFIVRNDADGRGLLREWYDAPTGDVQLARFAREHPQGLNICWDWGRRFWRDSHGNSSHKVLASVGIGAGG